MISKDKANEGLKKNTIFIYLKLLFLLYDKLYRVHNSRSPVYVE